MPSKAKRPYDFGEIPIARCNVLDVMSIVMPPSIPVPLFFDVDVSWAEEIRARYADLGHRVTFTSILLKAIAVAQRTHPTTRTHQLPTGQLVTLNEICAGFTVERMVKHSAAVFFGSIACADKKSILEISSELRAYAKGPMESIPQLQFQVNCLKYPSFVRQMMLRLGLMFPALRLKIIPASFGITSIGKWGCKTGIPPCITTTSFGVGEVEERPIVINKKLEIRPVVSLTYIFDHRILDGGTACRFMKDVSDLLQGGLKEFIEPELEQLTAMKSDQPIAIESKLNEEPVVEAA